MESTARNWTCCRRAAYCDETLVIISFWAGLGASHRVSVKRAGHGAGNDVILNLRFANLKNINDGLVLRAISDSAGRTVGSRGRCVSLL